MSQQVVFVYSGKGGVGKTTLAVNLAYGNAMAGRSTGLFDADFEGPNVGSMVDGFSFESPTTGSKNAIRPVRCGDVLVNSMEFLYPDTDGVYLSNSYLDGAIYQLLESPEWDVETLFVDLPPGTGEIHRELLHRFDGKAVLVSTPHSQSGDNLIKGIEMLQRFDVGIVGLIENFAYQYCPECGTKQEVFPGDSIERLEEEFGIERLAEFPLDSRVGQAANRGVPFVQAHPDADLTDRFVRTADELHKAYARTSVRPTSG